MFIKLVEKKNYKKTDDNFTLSLKFDFFNSSSSLLLEYGRKIDLGQGGERLKS